MRGDGQRGAGQVRGHFGHRDIEQPRSSGFERGEAAGRGDQAGSGVGDRVCAKEGLAVLPCDQPAGNRGVVAECHPVSAATTSAVARDGDPNARGACRQVPVEVDAELLERSRSRALDHHVGPLQQLIERGASLFVAEVELNDLLGRVEEVKERGGTAPGSIRPMHGLNLDHGRTRDREKAGAEWASPHRGEVDDE